MKWLFSNIPTLLAKYGIFVVLVVLFIICGCLSENFISRGNLINLPNQISITTILAFGETILIICGMLDLSCGSVLALSGVISVYVYMNTGANTGALCLAVAVAIAVGVLCNLINGLMVAWFKIPSFIATLAMMEMARGAAFMVSKGRDIPDIGGYTVLGQGMTLGIPHPIYFLAAIWLATWYFLKQTVAGRSVYAIGGNEEAAHAAGINVRVIKIKAYLVNGMFVGLAGALYMSRNNIGQPNAGMGYEFAALTAAVVGGTSFSGGIGSAAGTIAGALIIAFLDNIMVLTNVTTHPQRIIRGAIIALAVIYDINTKNRRVKPIPRLLGGRS
jgi:inositol transport system permease protein